MDQEETFPELTIKETNFVETYMTTGSPSKAYRTAYDVKKSKPLTIAVNASNLLKKPKIAARVRELREALAQEVHWDRVDSISVLAEISRSQEAKNSDRVNAVKAINTMLGYDKVTLDHTSSDGSHSKVDRVEISIVGQNATNTGDGSTS